MGQHSTANDAGDFNITYTTNLNGGPNTWDIHHINCALLADIRRELRELNRLLHCNNFVNIPKTLRAINKNTTKRKYVRKVKQS